MAKYNREDTNKIFTRPVKGTEWKTGIGSKRPPARSYYSKNVYGTSSAGTARKTSGTRREDYRRSADTDYRGSSDGYYRSSGRDGYGSSERDAYRNSRRTDSRESVRDSYRGSSEDHYRSSGRDGSRESSRTTSSGAKNQGYVRDTTRRREPGSSSARRTSGQSVRPSQQSGRRTGSTARSGYSGSTSRTKSEIYRRRKKRRTKQLLTRIGVVVIGLGLIVFLLVELFPVYGSVSMEAGTEAGISDFIRYSLGNVHFTDGSEEYDKNTPGTYRLEIQNGIFAHPCSLTIVDMTPPEVELRDLIIGVNDTCIAQDFIVSVNDLSETTSAFGTTPDLNQKGSEQEISVIVTDAGGNETEKTAKLTVLPINYRVTIQAGEKPDIRKFVVGDFTDDGTTYIATDLNGIDLTVPGEKQIEVAYKGTLYPAIIVVSDTEAPVFETAQDFTAYIGDSILYKNHVTVKDNSGSYDLKVDTSAVNPEQEGTYPVTYTATDVAGNSSTATLKVTIAQKSASEEELFSKADEIIAEILTDGMSQEEKVTAIYHYVHGSYLFVGDSDKSSYVKAALDMLASGQGDCYSFFALSKVLFDRAGIKNMDICYVNRPVHEHYWNLVDIGDGHGWYHYDATPRNDDAVIILWDTETLKIVDDGRYGYDPADYPPIP